MEISEISISFEEFFSISSDVNSSSSTLASSKKGLEFDIDILLFDDVLWVFSFFSLLLNMPFFTNIFNNLSNLQSMLLILFIELFNLLTLYFILLTS